MCGELVRNKLKNPYYYYACATRKRLKSCDNKNISKDYIEQSVINALFDNLFSPAIIDDAAKHIFESVAELQKDIPDDVKKMKSELSAANTKIKNIVDAIAEGMFQQSMKQKMDELTVIQQTLIIRIEEAVSQLSINKYSIKEIKDYLIQYQELKSMDPAEQKKCIEVFVDKIIVNDDDILVKAFTTKDKTEISIKIPKVLGHQGCQTTCTKSALQAMNSE